MYLYTRCYYRRGRRHLDHVPQDLAETTPPVFVFTMEGRKEGSQSPRTPVEFLRQDFHPTYSPSVGSHDGLRGKILRKATDAECRRREVEVVVEGLGTGTLDKRCNVGFSCKFYVYNSPSKKTKVRESPEETESPRSSLKVFVWGPRRKRFRAGSCLGGETSGDHTSA